MIAKSQYQELKNDFLEGCKIDWSGLWHLPWLLYEDFQIEENEIVQRITLGLIRDLLMENLIVVGDLDWDAGELVPWDGSIDEIIARIATEWDELGRAPDLLEIAWITTTEKGDRYVDEAL